MVNIIICQSCSHASPILPSIAFTIIHKSGKAAKKKREGLHGLVHHVNDVRWTWGGCRGGEAQLQNQHTGSSIWVSYCCSSRLKILVLSKLLVLISKKLTFKLSEYMFDYWSLPSYVHLNRVHSHDEWDQEGKPSPLFTFWLVRCCVLLWMQMEGKNREDLGTRLIICDMNTHN